MHNLLITLTAEQKVKWPEHLQELVFVYNATPHSSASFTPYYFFFGHDPRLPVDNLRRNHDRKHPHRDANTWVQLHRFRMQEPMKRTICKMIQKAISRKQRQDRGARDPQLPIGTNVLTRNRVIGRNKIQDMCNPTVYTVAGELPNSAVIVTSSTAGRVRVINRVDLLIFSTYEDDGEDEPVHSSRNVEAETDGSSSDKLIVLEHRADSSDSDVSVPKALRRRSTKGKHSNPKPLPKSVLKEEAAATNRSQYTYYWD
jgi:hypothetical protein